MCWKVSIPFKRESLSKEIPGRRGRHRGFQFQFPSNGKAYPKYVRCACCRIAKSFNSLQTGKPIQSHLRQGKIHHQELLFQFPSNGKAYPKAGINRKTINLSIGFNSLQTGKPIQRWVGETRSVLRTQYQVSIPFKRESLSKATILKTCIRQRVPKSFNSLQTGKPIQRQPTDRCGRQSCKFQFPSNGKAYPKFVGDRAGPLPSWVPFQFPSNGKAYPKDFIHHFHQSPTLWFQFPSNGKAYPK